MIPQVHVLLNTAAFVAAALFAGSALSQAASAPAAAPVAAPTAAAAPAADNAQGKVAWYGRKFAGRKTASGQRFNPAALTMAHKSLPFGTRVKVTNLKNNRSVIVRVNDRGPNTADRIGDLSQAAAVQLRMLHSGVIDATLEVLGTAAPAARRAKGKGKVKTKA